MERLLAGMGSLCPHTAGRFDLRPVTQHLGVVVCLPENDPKSVCWGQMCILLLKFVN